MKWGLLVFVLLSSGLFAASSSKNNSTGKPRLCFFELDNPHTSDNFITQANNELSGNDLNLLRTPKIDKNKSAETAFTDWIKKMKQKNIKCDGLTLSGHHTGDWYGKKGALSLKYLEALSCDPKYQNWFKNIKTLWLDGCNTVTDNVIMSDNPPTPDSETVRVVGKEIVDAGLEVEKYHITGTSQAYALSLDKNTSLSSRYLRIFPSAQIFGYNGAVDLGKNRAGRSFIVEHLSNLGKALKAEEAQALNEAEAQHNKQYLKLGLSAMFSNHCDEERIEAWESVRGGSNKPREAIENQYYKDISQLGCALILSKQLLDNPDSKEAQKALAEKIKSSTRFFIWTNETKELSKALELANLILNEDSGSDDEKTAIALELAKLSVLKTLDRITNLDNTLRGPVSETEPLKRSHLLFNNIYDTWQTAQNYKEDDKDFFESVQKKLKAKNFKDSIKARINSSQTSSIRKASYIKFYMKVNGLELSNLSDKEPKIQKQIDDLVLKAQCNFKQSNFKQSNFKQTKTHLCKGIETLRSPRQRELKREVRRALALSVADQLLQYELLTDSQKTDLLNNKNLFPEKRTDPFTLSTSIRFELSNKGAGSFLKELEKIKTPSRRSTAITNALTQNFFKNTGNHKQLNEMLNKGVNPKNFSNSKINESAFWDAMHDAFYNKSQSEKARIMAHYLNEADTEYVRNRLSDYSSNFDPPEKNQLCHQLKLKNDLQKYYAKCVIKCLRDIDYSCLP